MAGAAKEKQIKPLGWVWFTGLMLGIIACLPYVIEFLCSKAYPTHRGGVVVVTQATTAVGKATCMALLEDGYTVRGLWLVGWWVCGREEMPRAEGGDGLVLDRSTLIHT